MCSKQNLDTMKRKIRKLKQFETKIRFNGEMKTKEGLIWHDFFDLHQVPSGKAKYTLNMISTMNHDEYKNMIEEYFALLYYVLYREKGLTSDKLFNLTALEQLNLPFDANEMDIKKRFRELALKYHPDAGGDETKFIELMTIYKELINHPRP